MDIQWLVSVPASGLYAAREMLRGRRLVDAALAERIASPVEQFRATAEAWHVDPVAIVDHLTVISIEPSPPEQLARIAVRRIAGESIAASMAKDVARWMQQIQSLFLQVHPKALEELELRSTPLREQWEARGPGLMARLGKLIGSEPLVESASVVLVQPVLGGGGMAYPTYNRVGFEAMLASPWPELPEVVRLGWLLAQLQLDLPAIQGQLSRERTQEVGALAALPAVLSAAHEVELCGPIESVISQASHTWKLPPADEDTLWAWWETYVAQRPSWGSALSALDQLLRASS